MTTAPVYPVIISSKTRYTARTAITGPNMSSYLLVSVSAVQHLCSGIAVATHCCAAVAHPPLAQRANLSLSVRRNPGWQCPTPVASIVLQPPPDMQDEILSERIGHHIELVNVNGLNQALGYSLLEHHHSAKQPS